MIKRYFLHLAFKGSHYHGWQTQKDAQSVQSVLEEKLSSLCKELIKVHPCGRTDAGVHASQFFAHLNSQFPLEQKHLYPLNKILPKDIVAYDIIPVSSRVNAQLDALSRTYQYHFHLEETPFLAESSTYVECKSFDESLAEEALILIRKQSDFRSMCFQADKHNHTFCRIDSIQLHQYQNKKYYIEITANRFLKGMVRLLSQRIIEIAIQKRTVTDLKKALETGERVPFHTAAYPQGLYLTSVKYDFIDVKNRSVHI